LIFLYSFYSTITATILDVPLTAAVMNSTTTTHTKAKNDFKP
jgi:hypothetical protein